MSSSVWFVDRLVTMKGLQWTNRCLDPERNGTKKVVPPLTFTSTHHLPIVLPAPEDRECYAYHPRLELYELSCTVLLCTISQHTHDDSTISPAWMQIATSQRTEAKSAQLVRKCVFGLRPGCVSDNHWAWRRVVIENRPIAFPSLITHLQTSS